MSETVAFLAGLLGGLGVAFFEWYVSRPQRELERNFLSLQITQLSELVRDTAESVRHRLPGGEEYEFYRSSPSSDRDDFEGVPAPTGLRDGAQGIGPSKMAFSTLYARTIRGRLTSDCSDIDLRRPQET